MIKLAASAQRVALVQIASPDSETQLDRIERVESMLRQQKDVDLFVLPELWSAGYFNFDRYADLAETLAGPTVSMARRVARDLGSMIHLGSIIERDAAGSLYNTAVLINAAGNIAQTYRKIHVFGYQSLESELIKPGNQLSVVSTPLGGLSSTTCYDLRFPGLWQEISARGADIVIVPAAWPMLRREHWALLSQARAVEHQLWILACNACGHQGETQLGGSSRVIDPSGRVVAECGDDEEVLLVDIDPGEATRVRDEFPVIADRLSTQSYSALSTETVVSL